MTFYDTAHAEDRPERKRRARTQEEIILDFFKAHPDKAFSPLSVLHLCPSINPITPITSIRRAITDLTTEGKLEKTDAMTQGEYGMKTHTWRLKKQGPARQMQLL